VKRPDNMGAVRRTLATLLAALALTLSAAPAAAHDSSAPDPVEPYIVGGVLASPDTWPGMVALVTETSLGLMQFCGGTLVRADLVLTAAHCTEDFLADPGRIEVLIGRTDLQMPGGELLAVSAIVQHPSWNPATYQADISILRLGQPTTRPVVRFVTQVSEPNWVTTPAATLVGWGAVNPDGSETDSRLRELDVEVLSDQQCVQSVATYQVGIDLCAGAPSTGACFGDSGGPMMTTTGGTARLAGVISRGPSRCGNAPSIVTRVAAYADWIYQSTLSGATTRTSGPDRYTTAAALSSRFQPDVAVAYLVTGEAFPDAVTAAAVAGAAGGPVLLARRDELPDATRSELARLRPQRLVVVGGRGAISDAVAQAAGTAAGVGATRLSGPDRYATAAALATDANPSGAATVHLTVGTSFPDAVASGPVAGGPAGGPVLLTEAGSLPAATRQALDALAPTRVVILGGASAVGPAVETELAALLPGVQLQRIAGADRFATSAALSASTFSPGVPVVYVATGMAFPDALASGPVGVLDGAPVLLLDGARIPPSVAAEIRRLQPGRIEVLGGTSAVPLDTMWRLDGLH
jgi:secreted trypsin-like serine protease